MKIRHLLATSAATALLSPLAHAAGDPAVAQPAPAAEGANLPTINVTDTRRLPESFDQRYATTQVLTRTDLDRLSPSDPSITQALATLPGVTVSQNGGPPSASVSIRGSSASQVAVFIDGIRIGSPTTGIAPWADLPTESFERVEVISGPAAASFGANAMGGVVQLFTRRAANQPNQTTVSFGGGSNKTFDTQLRTSGTVPSTGPLAALGGPPTRSACIRTTRPASTRRGPSRTGTRRAAIRTTRRISMRASATRATTGRSRRSRCITGPICPTTTAAMRTASSIIS